MQLIESLLMAKNGGNQLPCLTRSNCKSHLVVVVIVANWLQVAELAERRQNWLRGGCTVANWLQGGRIGCAVAELAARWQNWLWLWWQGGRNGNVLFLRKKVPGLGFNMGKWVAIQ